MSCEDTTMYDPEAEKAARLDIETLAQGLCEADLEACAGEGYAPADGDWPDTGTPWPDGVDNLVKRRWRAIAHFVYLKYVLPARAAACESTDTLPEAPPENESPPGGPAGS